MEFKAFEQRQQILMAFGVAFKRKKKKQSWQVLGSIPTGATGAKYVCANETVLGVELHLRLASFSIKSPLTLSVGAHIYWNAIYLTSGGLLGAETEIKSFYWEL